MTTVELEHAKTSRGKVLVETREHDLSKYDNWGGTEFIDVLTSLQDPLGMYGHEVRRLSLQDRCRLVEKLLDGDYGTFMWKAGWVNIPPHVAATLWERFGE